MAAATGFALGLTPYPAEATLAATPAATAEGEQAIELSLALPHATTTTPDSLTATPDTAPFQESAAVVPALATAEPEHPTLSASQTAEASADAVDVSPAEMAVARATPEESSGGEETQASPAEAPAVDDSWHEVKVRSGDNMAHIFKREGADRGDLHRIVALGGPAEELKRLQPGRTLRMKLDPDGGVEALRYEISRIRTLVVEREGDTYTAAMDQLDVEKRSAFATGTIEDSLFLSAKRAGLPDRLIMELANIFGWDVDFALDVRKDDHFAVVWEEHYSNGEKIKNGDILAAEFVNQGKSYRAVRYTDPSGVSNYFTPDGYSMRKAFLRSPVDFRRISSGFTRERWHPVLGVKRPHRGVDYAAAIGTPVKAAGDGKVIFAGTKSGYGRTLILQHGSTYTTLYGHLNGFKRGIRSGVRVKQGQTVAYVGKTGLATGPHLHYEFRVNGAHRNPLTVKLPQAQPVAKQHKPDFARQTAPLVATLEQHLKTRLALAE